MYTNYNPANKSSLSFNGLQIKRDAFSVIERVLKQEQMDDFKKLRVSLAEKEKVDTFIVSTDNGTKLNATIYPSWENLGLNIDTYSYSYSQGIFETTMHFLQQVCEKATIMEQKLKEQSVVSDGLKQLKSKFGAKE